MALASFIAAADAWMVPPAPAGCVVRSCGADVLSAPACASLRVRPLCMDEATQAPETVSDFTEDLLEALTTDDEPLVADAPAEFAKGADGVELTPLPSYGNAQSVSALRAKYKLHENDTGSTQVQIAVLTARIAYMTKHMQENRKDYASLRGLTSMVTRRRKLLEYLLREDLSEFKRLTSELGIRTNQLLKPKLGGARGRRE